MRTDKHVDANARKAFFAHVEENKRSFIDRLAMAVAVPSVSAQAEHRIDCLAMVQHYRDLMTALSIENEIRELGQQAGSGLQLPPVIVGRYGSDPQKRTICA